tara:strand:+ start:11258 stop:11683 length:426 start_codon:yes stop_codon:yes gene_type:complete
MKLTFDQRQCFSVPEKLYTILNTELAKQTDPDSSSLGITFNFRDLDYSASSGGYHPVEIRINRNNINMPWELEYLTDFCFVGFPYPELAKDIDVCFQTKQIYTQFGIGMSKKESDEFLAMFLNNFISYVEMDVFTVKITFD